MSIIIPSIQDVKAANLPSGTIRSGGQLADLVYPDLHLGCVLAMPFSLGATGLKSLDVSGYNNNGTLTNGPTWRGRDGLLLDGVDDYVEVADSTSIDDTTLSVSVRFKTVNDTSGAIVAKGIVADYQWAIFYEAGGKLTCVTWQANGSNHLAVISVASGLNDSEWHHTAMTVIGGIKLEVSVDGSIVGTSTSPTGTWNIEGASPINIGRRPDGVLLLAASIDDVLIYNRALTATEMSQLYTAGRPGVTGGIYQARLRPRVFAFTSAATPWRYVRRQSQIIGSGLGV